MNFQGEVVFHGSLFFLLHQGSVPLTVGWSLMVDSSKEGGKGGSGKFTHILTTCLREIYTHTNNPQACLKGRNLQYMR